MASIMTNTSAMTALQTLRRVTGDLETTQDRISTGLKVNSAKENAAYWSIATTMKADVAGFKAVKESLELGSGTTNTASVAAKSISESLTNLKQRIIAGQAQGVDKKLIQADVDQTVRLITGAANDASFNGDNLLRVTYSNDGTAKDKDVRILASLSRDDTGVVPSYIDFQRQDMRVASIVGKATIEQQTDSTNDLKASLDIKLGAPGATFIDGQNLGLKSLELNITDETGVKRAVTVDLSAINYDTDLATTQGLIETAINAAVGPEFDVAFNGDTLEFTDQDPNTDGNFRAKIDGLWMNTTESDAFGGLADLTQLDVVNNAAKSLAVIDKMIDSVISKATVIGSIENRVSVQNDFVSKLTDAMNKGIGALVDADMNEESSRLQALQVQQQLAIQALSIANQGPQNILSLFR
ncbi:flagellin [Azospirillum brasilense]|uniref:Flagellin n=1 Tax=Azospirillum brasilense TaxID=192 RepID=A0A560AHG6_AZOBR|nr:flagellin [Azospirillum brasilense]TWA59807.1 flagellin [Azospirillum brasilense]